MQVLTTRLVWKFLTMVTSSTKFNRRVDHRLICSSYFDQRSASLTDHLGGPIRRILHYSLAYVLQACRR
jgi:hypothetical protein